MELNLLLIVAVSFLFLPLCFSRSYFPQESRSSEVSEVRNKLWKAKLQRKFGFNLGQDNTSVRLRKPIKQQIAKRMELMESETPSTSSYHLLFPSRSQLSARNTSSNRRSSQPSSLNRNGLPVSPRFPTKLYKKLYQLSSTSPSRNDCVFWTSPEGTRHLLKRLKGQNGSDSISDCRPKRSTYSRPYYAPGSSVDHVEPLR